MAMYTRVARELAAARDLPLRSPRPDTPLCTAADELPGVAWHESRSVANDAQFRLAALDLWRRALTSADGGGSRWAAPVAAPLYDARGDPTTEPGLVLYYREESDLLYGIWAQSCQ